MDAASGPLNRLRPVTAVLGPTNTGKTHLAIERMLGHESGVIGLPLRLLAREVYDKIVARIGEAHVALITGEEKIKPPHPRYYICTVEAMPLETGASFLAVDEVQLAADGERGHVFTERMLHARGESETLLLGASTMREAIRELLPSANIVSRPRLSKLAYAGQKKITRLPRRSAIVAFSANDVYAIAELVRRQRGGAAVVLGALSPRTRNAQVALYQSGEVDFLVATDAVGMGLNLDVDHLAFAATRKFDGQSHRELTPGEIGQIAGRAGRWLNDGTFGITGAVAPFAPELVERLENHEFEPVRAIQWRSRDLDFGSVDRLRESLRAFPREPRLTRARMVDDVTALENLASDSRIRDLAMSPASVKLLWEMCQIPDYRKISAASHAELVATLYRDVMSDTGRISEEWFGRQVALADRTDGDLDTLSNRIAHIRTWTFVSHRAEWLDDPLQWQGKTREIEDRLSDALHERLMHRFVDRRTSVLMRRLRDREELFGEIAANGSVDIEGHFVGRLLGFRFTADSGSGDIHGKAARHAAAQLLAGELSARAETLTAAPDADIALSATSEIIWRDAPIARLEQGETGLQPQIRLLADEHLAASARDRILKRLESWFAALLELRLAPLMGLAKADNLSGLARGIAFRLIESFGVLPRTAIAEDLRALDQPGRASLRAHGVRFGAFNIYIPALLKPAASSLLLLLWGLAHGSAHGFATEAMPVAPRQGLTSIDADPALPEAFYRVAGYHQAGSRVVRIDMLERLADMLRLKISWRGGQEGEAPAGATGDGGFRVTPEMMALIGCSGENLASILSALGFRLTRVALAPATPLGEVPAEPAGASAEASAQFGEPTPASDEIWRPGRPQPAAASQTRNPDRHRRPRPKLNPRPNAQKPIREPRRGSPAPRPVDKHSPFAALAELRRKLTEHS